MLGKLKEGHLRDRIQPASVPAILRSVGSSTLAVKIDANIAEKAGEIKFEEKQRLKGLGGMTDSVLYAVTLLRRGKAITGDSHSQGFP